jgi:hypothetical protein
MSDAKPHRLRWEPEFVEITRNFHTTYESPEVGRVLRLAKDKARKSAENGRARRSRGGLG